MHVPVCRCGYAIFDPCANYFSIYWVYFRCISFQCIIQHGTPVIHTFLSCTHAYIHLCACMHCTSTIRTRNIFFYLWTKIPLSWYSLPHIIQHCSHVMHACTHTCMYVSATRHSSLLRDILFECIWRLKMEILPCTCTRKSVCMRAPYVSVASPSVYHVCVCVSRYARVSERPLVESCQAYMC